VKATLKILDRRWPIPEEEVTAKFKCEDSVVIITGWTRPPNACYKVVIESLEYRKRSNELLIALNSQKRDKDHNTTCEGVAYKFQLKLVFDKGTPNTINMVYESPDDGSKTSTSVRNESC
jgi:hypothetical protein